MSPSEPGLTSVLLPHFPEVDTTPAACNQTCRRIGSHLHRRWGVVLAGGDGVRLRDLTRIISGDDRPKQYCPLLGDGSLLEQTGRRIASIIPNEQTLYSLSAAHRPFFHREPGLDASQRLVQPLNRGTAPPILHGLLSIDAQDRDALVGILPSDHYYGDETAFRFALDAAFDIAALRPGAVILLGVRPEAPEVQFGWLELGSAVSGLLPGVNRLSLVHAFREKPGYCDAQDLFRRGALLSTFVMVGHVGALLDMTTQALGPLRHALAGAPLWSGGEVLLPDSVYRSLPSADFSHDVLSRHSNRLFALELANSGWTDLGDPQRVLQILRDTGQEASWVPRWKRFSARPALAS